MNERLQYASLSDMTTGKFMGAYITKERGNDVDADREIGAFLDTLNVGPVGVFTVMIEHSEEPPYEARGRLLSLEEMEDIFPGELIHVEDHESLDNYCGPVKVVDGKLLPKMTEQ